MTLHLRTLALFVGVALAAAACGDDSSSSAPGPTQPGPSDPDTTAPESTTTAPLGGRGWLEGDELEWHATATEASASAGFAMADAAAAEAASDAPAGSRSAVGDETSEPIIAPDPPVDRPLAAGSIDDGDDFVAYAAYRDSIAESGIPVRPLDVSDPTVISVVGNNGLPVLDAAVVVRFSASDQQGQKRDDAIELRTTADGTTRFLPHALAADAAGPWTVEVTVGDTTTTGSFETGRARIELTVDEPGGIDGSVPVDIHFLLDATGSMGDEIDRLRTNMAMVAEQIAALPSAPDVRFGMTVYRDEGDLFLTRTFDLTGDLASFLEALDDVVADGGGDYPEALDEALADALARPEWRRDGAVELIVLIADAPAQVERLVEAPYTRSALTALERGVKILPVAASGTDDQAEYIFRELAYVTGGRFVFLSYGVDGELGTATGPGTDITPDDYDQLPLDQLVVRLVEDEILALTGGEPAPASTTTTAPPPTTTQ